MKEFWRKIMDGDDQKSSKRFITLIAAGIFFLTCLLILFFTFYLILYVPRGEVNVDLLNELSKTREDLFFIVAGGLSLITVEGLAKILIKKYTKPGEGGFGGYGGMGGYENQGNIPGTFENPDEGENNIVN